MSRAVKLLALLLACAGLTVGVAACGGNDDKTDTVELTEVPSNPQNDSATGGADSAPTTPPADDAAGDDAAAGGDDAAGGADADRAAAGEDSAAAGGAGAADDEAGKAVFTSSCAGCHALAAAGATGTVGPNLDDLRPTEAAVDSQVRNGGGGMPAFSGTLQPDQIRAVSAYVSAAAGS